MKKHGNIEAGVAENGTATAADFGGAYSTGGER